MNVTRRTVLAVAPAGAALAGLGTIDPATTTPSPQPAAAAAPVAPADWLVALRSGLAQRSAP